MPGRALYSTPGWLTSRNIPMIRSTGVVCSKSPCIQHRNRASLKLLAPCGSPRNSPSRGRAQDAVFGRDQDASGNGRAAQEMHPHHGCLGGHRPCRRAFLYQGCYDHPLKHGTQMGRTPDDKRFRWTVIRRADKKVGGQEGARTVLVDREHTALEETRRQALPTTRFPFEPLETLFGGSRTTLARLT